MGIREILSLQCLVTLHPALIIVDSKFPAKLVVNIPIHSLPDHTVQICFRFLAAEKFRTSASDMCRQFIRFCTEQRHIVLNVVESYVHARHPFIYSNDSCQFWRNPSVRVQRLFHFMETIDILRREFRSLNPSQLVCNELAAFLRNQIARLFFILAVPVCTLCEKIGLSNFGLS